MITRTTRNYVNSPKEDRDNINSKNNPYRQLKMVYRKVADNYKYTKKKKLHNENTTSFFFVFKDSVS